MLQLARMPQMLQLQARPIAASSMNTESYMINKLLASGFAALLLGCGSVHAQEQISLVVPFAAGGPTDQITRLIAADLTRLTGANVIVENKPGAAGIVAAQFVANAKPDGSVYMVGSPSSLVLNQGLYKKLPYDPERDFVPVAGLTRSPLVLVANDKRPYDNAAELVRSARQNMSNPVKMGTPGSGTIPHIAGSYFASLAGIQMLDVPFKGVAPAIVSLMSGDIDVVFDTLSTSTANIASGKLKVLGIASEARFSLLPNVPTLREQGYDVLASSWFGLVAPARTPQATIDRVNQAINQILADPVFSKKLLDSGSEPMPGTAVQFAAFIQGERDRWLPEVRRLNLSAD